MARLALFAALTLAMLTGALSQTNYTIQMFNCDRAGMECMANSTDGMCTDPLIECTCASGYDHPASNIKHECINTTAAEPCDSGLECQNNGTCFKIEGSDVCFCPQDYTGPDCSVPRVELMCNATEMTVKVAPHGSFPGKIYPLGKLGDANCEFPAITDMNTMQTFPYDDPNTCGIRHTVPADNTTDPSDYGLTVIIQYSPGIIQTTDQALNLVCRFDPRNHSTSVLIDDNFVTNELDPGTVSDLAQAVRIRVFKEGVLQTGVPYVFNLGDIIRLELELQVPNTPDFRAVYLVSAYVKQSESATGDDSILLVNRGCRRRNQVMSGDFNVTGTPPNVISLELPVFVFTRALRNNMNTLLFEFTLQLCNNANIAECAKRTNCGDVPSSNRRRRAARNDEVTLTEGIYVRIGNTTTEEEITKGKGQTDTTAEECLKDPALQAVVSVLGLLAFALLLALIVVIAVACCRPNSRRDRFEADDRSFTSSTQKLDMQIPRPRV